ncbi:hypothetical protein [Pseudarthrobacter sp. S9]|uniref:hypothetical protein n=1 Tax=Pseudarthrobacter sp. S9 TaxID=3418421 RepID=UPI003D05F066
MNQRKIVFLSLALAAAIAAALGVTSCAAGGQRAAGDQGTGSATPAASAASPAQQASAPAGAASASAAPPPATPTAAKPTGSTAPVAGVKSFTFPDGHLSFSYPSDWSIRVVESAAPGATPGRPDGVRAVLADATGNELASVTSGTYAGGATGPVLRTVLDTAPVPGLKDAAGEQLSFGFAFDSFADQPDFHMGVRRDRDFQPSLPDAGYSQVQMPNGAAEAKVIFGSPAFASVEAAKAWMTTEQYSQLKRLLFSLKYS